jgi:hypothetical protein
MGEFYEGTQVFEQGDLLEHLPRNNGIVPQRHYNRENNEVA